MLTTKKNTKFIIFSGLFILLIIFLFMISITKVKAEQYFYSTNNNLIGDNTEIKKDIEVMNLDYEDFTFSLDNYTEDDEIKNKYYSWNCIGMYEYIDSNGECNMYIYIYNPVFCDVNKLSSFYKFTISFFGISYDFYNPNYFLSERVPNGIYPFYVLDFDSCGIIKFRINVNIDVNANIQRQYEYVSCETWESGNDKSTIHKPIKPFIATFSNVKNSNETYVDFNINSYVFITDKTLARCYYPYTEKVIDNVKWWFIDVFDYNSIFYKTDSIEGSSYYINEFKKSSLGDGWGHVSYLARIPQLYFYNFNTNKEIDDVLELEFEYYESNNCRLDLLQGANTPFAVDSNSLDNASNKTKTLHSELNDYLFVKVPFYKKDRDNIDKEGMPKVDEEVLKSLKFSPNSDNSNSKVREKVYNVKISDFYKKNKVVSRYLKNDKGEYDLKSINSFNISMYRSSGYETYNFPYILNTKELLDNDLFKNNICHIDTEKSNNFKDVFYTSYIDEDNNTPYQWSCLLDNSYRDIYFSYFNASSGSSAYSIFNSELNTSGKEYFRDISIVDEKTISDVEVISMKYKANGKIYNAYVNSGGVIDSEGVWFPSQTEVDIRDINDFIANIKSYIEKIKIFFINLGVNFKKNFKYILIILGVIAFVILSPIILPFISLVLKSLYKGVKTIIKIPYRALKYIFVKK